MGNFVITIARGYGSGGTYVARKLSDRLGGIPVYDSEILVRASEESGISEALMFELNDKIKAGKALFADKEGVYKGVTYTPESKKYLSDENLFANQAEVIKRLAETESCIILGKAANYILRKNKNVLRLNIQSNYAYSIKTIKERIVVDEFEAERRIETYDKYRKDYYKYFTGKNWLDPLQYDLSINISTMGEDNVVDMIESIARQKFDL